ncbi:transglycosylase SLT domain-containing protein [Actinacidiphila yeochonensis]|uniref:transglycosylase SLT domain-containing protein n=1 Tax=Actinacidiphila yeochonensis TaxID=89050 RepID=UPI0007C7DAB8|nr:transglycosylase SLT domain-containing protein [Actinacidiphila yeochonensis]
MQLRTMNPMKLGTVSAFSRMSGKRKVVTAGSAAAAAAMLAVVGVQAAGAGSAVAAGGSSGSSGSAVSAGVLKQAGTGSGVQTTDLGTHQAVTTATPQAMALTASVEKAPAVKKAAPVKKATTVKKAAVKHAKAVSYPNTLDGWIRQSLAIMHKDHIPGTYEGIHRNIIRESSGNPKAINLWDINARNGIPSKGLLQVIDPTFQRFHVAGTSWNIYNPVANITAACNYAADRYGSMDNVNSAY